MRSARATGSKQRAHAGYLRRCYPTVEDASEKMQEDNNKHLSPARHLTQRTLLVQRVTLMHDLPRAQRLSGP